MNKWVSKQREGSITKGGRQKTGDKEGEGEEVEIQITIERGINYKLDKGTVAIIEEGKVTVKKREYKIGNRARKKKL